MDDNKLNEWHISKKNSQVSGSLESKINAIERELLQGNSLKSSIEAEPPRKHKLYAYGANFEIHQIPVELS